MHVLVAYGSKMGGTAGIAELIGDALTDGGFQADVRPVAEVSQLDRYDAVVIGGALYTGHWHRQARRIGARGHATFGGRLPADAKRFPASAMAKTHAGDWRDPEHIRGWAADVAMELLSLDQLGRLHA